MNKSSIILLFLVYSFSYSQNFSAGPIIGINTSQVSNDNLGGFNKIGLRLGGFVHQAFENFDLQMELQYINKGSRENIGQNTYSEGYRFNVNYIEMPLLIQKSNSYIYDIDIELGLIFGYLLNWTETINGVDESGDDINSIEYSFLIGFTKQLYQQLYLNTRLSNSLFPIRGTFNKLDGRGDPQHNTCISFSLYYFLNKRN
tara:strand:- start:156 stop:758 length:603 start_codon:yes stop_codon:yes gene_type:complete